MSDIPYIPRDSTERFFDRFDEAIQNPRSHPLMFNVWGIGGVGKTTLLDKLQEKYPAFYFVRVYFGTTKGK